MGGKLGFRTRWQPVLLFWILEIHFRARPGKIHGEALPPQTGPTAAIGRIGSLLILPGVASLAGLRQQSAAAGPIQARILPGESGGGFVLRRAGQRSEQHDGQQEFAF